MIRSRELLFGLGTVLMVTACGGLPDGSDRGSQPAEIGQRMGSTEIRVVYSRPMARGRVLFGELVPYDSIWNPGANEATWFGTSDNITIEGETLPAGKSHGPTGGPSFSANRTTSSTSRIRRGGMRFASKSPRSRRRMSRA